MILLHEFECDPSEVLVNIDQIVTVTRSDPDNKISSHVYLAKPVEGRKRSLAVVEDFTTIQALIKEAREARKNAPVDLSVLENNTSEILNDVGAIRSHGR